MNFEVKDLMEASNLEVYSARCPTLDFSNCSCLLWEEVFIMMNG